VIASKARLALFVLALVPGTRLEADEPGTDSPPGSATVNVVAYHQAPGGKAGGSCKPVHITAEPSADGRARVGFFETRVGGTGNQWRSAGWMAAVTASILSDFDPRLSRVSIEYQGAIDGPSAGAVLTVGILAAARGDSVRADAAMTGAINPDGSIGPVSGIPHKIDGAAAAGMKLLLIPADKRYDVDENTGQRVDLVEYGQQQGVEVRRVFNVYEAYEQLTGAELERAAEAGVPRISPTVEKRMKQTILTWVNRYQHTLNSYQNLPGEAKESDEVDQLYSMGVQSLTQCHNLLSEGEVTAALWDCIVGTGYAYLAMELARCQDTYAKQGYQGVVARLRDNAWLAKDVQEMTQRLRDETPRTLDQLSVYLGACDAYLEGVSLQISAKARLAALPEEESPQAIALAADAAESQILAWLDMQLVGDYLDWQDAYAGTPIPQLTAWLQTGDYLFNAASANLAVFDSLVIEPQAAQQSLAPDRVRERLASKDKIYSIVRIAQSEILPNLETILGEGDAANYAYLAMNIYTHTRTAGLLAKYYALGAEVNEFGAVTRIGRERTLSEMLTYADDQSRRNIALLQDAGVSATVCAQIHAIATIKARRDVPQKLEALHEFWAADAHARILKLLSGLAARQESPAVALDPLEEAAASAKAGANGARK
jgi:hypothetical protein